LHQARGRNGKCHQQHRPAHPPPRKWPGLLRVAVMVVMMAVVMTAMTVIVTGVVVVTV
jgi:hypothetical protein